jgi:hypothetical protein
MIIEGLKFRVIRQGWIIFLTLSLCGCIIAPPLPKLPEFKPDKQVCPEPVICPTLAESRPTIAMPDAIPNTAYIDIQNGRIIKINEGGERLIRSYALIRKTIKAWQQ